MEAIEVVVVLLLSLLPLLNRAVLSVYLSLRSPLSFRASEVMIPSPPVREEISFLGTCVSAARVANSTLFGAIKVRFPTLEHIYEKSADKNARAFYPSLEAARTFWNLFIAPFDSSSVSPPCVYLIFIFLIILFF